MEKSAGSECSGLSEPAADCVFPALYHGPVYYFARLLRQEEIILEQYENYGKQSYRNRCLIMGPNAPVSLSIPVSRPHGVKTLFRDIRIHYEGRWNRIHWRSLQAAYASSPYFELMADEWAPFYEQHFDFLLDYNRRLLEITLSTLGASIPVRFSDKFTPIRSKQDPRYFIHPKKDIRSFDPDFRPGFYQQVFSDRLGFLPNLSILDLLFNLGSEARAYLQESLKTKSGKART